MADEDLYLLVHRPVEVRVDAAVATDEVVEKAMGAKEAGDSWG